MSIRLVDDIIGNLSLIIILNIIQKTAKKEAAKKRRKKRRERDPVYRMREKKYQSEYYKKNKEQLLRKRKEEYENNLTYKMKRRKYQREYREKNKELREKVKKICNFCGLEFEVFCKSIRYCSDECRIKANKEWHRIYNKKNKEHIYRLHRKNYKRRVKNDPLYAIKDKLNKFMQLGMWNSLRKIGGNKNRHCWENIVGYKVKNLRKHLESLFISGMTWKNYGSVWEIDHIRPIASFDYTSPEDSEFKECWSLSNLQPLWISENRRKNSIYDGKRYYYIK